MTNPDGTAGEPPAMALDIDFPIMMSDGHRNHVTTRTQLIATDIDGTPVTFFCGHVWTAPNFNEVQQARLCRECGTISLEMSKEVPELRSWWEWMLSIDPTKDAMEAHEQAHPDHRIQIECFPEWEGSFSSVVLNGERMYVHTAECACGLSWP